MTKISKAELVKQIAIKTELSHSNVVKVLDAYHDFIVSQTIKGIVVAYPGFGTYQVNDTKARVGINPKTMEKIQIAAGKRMSFKAAKQLKERLKKS